MAAGDYTNYEEWKGWQPEYFGRFSKEDELYYSLEFGRVFAGKESLVGKRVIEIGFGGGTFAGWCALNGADYSGVEVIDALVQCAKQQGIEAYSTAAQSLGQIYPCSSADVIVAFDVFEHLDIANLKKTLGECREILRPGGVLIGRVPSGDSPFSRAIQYGDITHRTILGSSAIRQLAGEVDLQISAISEPAFPIRGLGPYKGLRRSVVYAMRLIVNKFLSSVMMGNADAVLTPNIVFVMVRAKN
jgi:SAM-dependent methyltransferase